MHTPCYNQGIPSKSILIQYFLHMKLKAKRLKTLQLKSVWKKEITKPTTDYLWEYNIYSLHPLTKVRKMRPKIIKKINSEDLLPTCVKYIFHIQRSFLHVGLLLIKNDPSITDYRGEMTFMNDTDICATQLLVCRKGTIQSRGNFNPSHQPMDQFLGNFCVHLPKIKSLSCLKHQKGKLY